MIAPLSEYLIVGTRSLKKRDALHLAPNEKPIACIRNMALATAPPGSLETMHAMATAQLLARARCVFNNQVNHACQIAFIKPPFSNSLKVS